MRLDLLPALERARPGFGGELLSSRAAPRIGANRWNRSSTHSAFQLLPPLIVPAAPLVTLPAEALAVLWPAIAARAGVSARLAGHGTPRGVHRVGQAGRKIPLSGGAGVGRTATTFVVTASAAE